MDDLNKEVRKARKAVDATPRGNPDLADRLDTLANLLRDRYDEMGKTDDLEEAISFARKAVDATPRGNPDLADRLDTLSDLLWNRYKDMGKTDDLEEAISLSREAIDITTEGGSDRATLLDALSDLLWDRYKEMGKTDNLEEAISLTREAIDITTEDGSDRASLLDKLAALLSLRYNRKKRTDDPKHTAQITVLSGDGLNVGIAQTVSVEIGRTGDAEDLEEGTRLAQEAVDMLTEDDPALARALAVLSDMYSKQYDRTGMKRYIKKALKNARKAVDITPEDDPDLAGAMNQLSLMYDKRYLSKPKKSCLEETMRLARKVIDITPKDDPAFAAYINNLAGRLADQYRKTGDKKTLDESIECSMKAFSCPSVNPLTRIKAARPAIQLLVASGDFEKASSLAEKAVDLLPLVCRRNLSLEDQQNAALETSGLASDTCSVLLRNGDDPGRAVEYLEHGRGLIIGYLMDNRGDVSELADRYPKEAKRFERLRSKVSLSVDQREPLEVRQRLSQEHGKAVANFESYLKHIRRLDGFDRFLLPPSADSLKAYAAEGPIVIVNVSWIGGGDALIILPSEIKHISLPDFTASEAKDYRLVLGLNSGSLRLIEGKAKPKGDADKFRELLGRLWTRCVQLVFGELGFRPRKRGSRPRVWWIGTGLASSLPFHAAGFHSAGSVENAFSYAISSYTPSIKALQYARDKAKVRPRSQSVLLVTMPKTPGAEDLPGVDDEGYAIERLIEDPHYMRMITQPSAERVLKEIQNCTVAHFACHGSSDLMNPTHSFLAFQGQSNYIPDKLTVHQISEAHLGHAWLAYLSACSTAENRVSELVDEALHLASGFQVAGFGHTIASMWPSNDDICVQVASTFYRELIKKDAIHAGNRAVPAALDAAVQEVRAKNVDKPYLWAQYIHQGA